MGNSSSRTTSKVSPKNGEPVGGARGKTAEIIEEKMKGVGIADEEVDSQTFPSDESGLMEESDVTESDEDEEEGKLSGFDS